MAQIIDQIVKISIQDAISSVTTVDVNTVALVGKAEGKDAAEVSSLAGAKTAFGEVSELYQMMEALFAQDSQPSRVVGIPAGSDALAAVQAASENFDFYHVVVATDDAQALALASIKEWHEWAADVKKMIHIQVPNVDAMAGTDGRAASGYDRVAVSCTRKRPQSVKKLFTNFCPLESLLSVAQAIPLVEPSHTRSARA